jgi:predicted permease
VKTGLTTIDMRIAKRQRRTRWVDAWIQDLRYVVRSLSAARGFTLLTVATLALGIGANGALFTVVDRLFLRDPTGVHGARDIVRLYRYMPGSNLDGRSQPYSGFIHYPGFDSIADAMPAGSITGYVKSRHRLGRGEDPPQTETAWVAPYYFSLLRVGSPTLGRYLTDDECQVPSNARVAVISFKEWKRRYGGDPGVLGTAVEFQGTVFSIVGVAARGFDGVDVDSVSYWMPMGTFPFPFQPPWYQDRSFISVRMLVRGAQPGAQLETVATAGFRAGTPAREQRQSIVAASLIESRGPLNATNEEALSIRLGGVALLVLFIACANAAGLMLARSMSRRTELAVRLALGMSQGRTASLLLAESLVLSVAAGAASLVVAYLGGGALQRTMLPDVEWVGALLDGRLVIFALAVSFVVAVVTGLPAALSATRAGLAPVLKSDGRGGGERPSMVRPVLLVAQVSLSIVLLVGAAAFTLSLYRATSIDTGYNVDQLLTLRLRAEVGLLPRAQTTEVLEQLRPLLKGHPSVQSVALAGTAPLSGYVISQLFRRDGSKIPSAGELSPSYMTVSPGFFQTAGVTIDRGRDFTADDTTGAPPVVAVNRAMATALWPDTDAIGQCFRMGTADRPCLEVVAVVENTNRDGLIDKGRGQSPMYFVPQPQARGEFASPFYAIVRLTDGHTAEAAAAGVRSAVRGSLPEGVHATVAPLAQSFDRQLRPWRVGTWLFTSFGLLALVVASVGIYSTMAFSAGRRTREMGIRVALGAARSSVVSLILREGLVLVLIGLVAGGTIAIFLGRFIESLLYQSSPSDPVVLISASLVMLVFAIAGCLVPALRAARVDPTITLRAE